MGFWIYNPPDPCCHPPAGWCQCQPCRWKVTSISSAAFLDAEETGAVPKTPFALHGATRHTHIKINGGIGQHGPPWYRMWRGLVDYEVFVEGDFFSLSSWMAFWFGFAWWRLPAGWTPRDRHTFGLSLRGITVDSTGFQVPQEEGPFSGFLFIHQPGLSDKWNCHGPNRLYYVGDVVGEFDEDVYCVVEPDL